MRRYADLRARRVARKRGTDRAGRALLRFLVLEHRRVPVPEHVAHTAKVVIDEGERDAKLDRSACNRGLRGAFTASSVKWRSRARRGGRAASTATSAPTSALAAMPPTPTVSATPVTRCVIDEIATVGNA